VEYRRDEKCIQNFDRNVCGMRKFGTPRRRWDKVQVDLKEIDYAITVWTYFLKKGTSSMFL
jgi:hypothetical protein